MSDRIVVAVGIVINEHGQVLVAKRHPYQDQGDCWEFPGGKIEPNETVTQAIKRELFEEVGLEILDSEPWLTIDHDYAEKAVSLQVHKITKFSGMAIGKENQIIDWMAPKDLMTLTWPEANKPIVAKLNQCKL